MHWGTWGDLTCPQSLSSRRPWVHSWRCPAVADSSPSALSFFDSHQPRAEPRCTTRKESRVEVQGPSVSARLRPWPQAAAAAPGMLDCRSFPCQSISLWVVAARVALATVPPSGPCASSGTTASLSQTVGIFSLAPVSSAHPYSCIFNVDLLVHLHAGLNNDPFL